MTVPLISRKTSTTSRCTFLCGTGIGSQITSLWATWVFPSVRFSKPVPLPSGSLCCPLPVRFLFLWWREINFLGSKTVISFASCSCNQSAWSSWWKRGEDHFDDQAPYEKTFSEIQHELFDSCFFSFLFFFINPTLFVNFLLLSLWFPS